MATFYTDRKPDFVRRGTSILGTTLLVAAASAAGATITVTGVADSVAVDGVVTLREALLSINRGADINADVTGNRVGSYGASDSIHFAIGSGPQTIQPISALPAILKPVLLDGTSQPGFAGAPLITLNGSVAGAAADGLVIAEHIGSSVLAVQVSGFGRDGLWISTHIFAGNFDLPLPADLVAGAAPSTQSLASALHGIATPLVARSTPRPAAMDSVATSVVGVISSTNGGVGIRVDGALSATSVEVAGNAGDGVWIDTGQPVTMIDCAIHNNGHNGMRVLRDSDSTGLIVNAASSASAIHDNAGNGIVLGDPYAQTGAVNAAILDSEIYANQIGVLVQQRDANLAPTTSSFAYNAIHGNRSSGLHFISTFFRPVTIGAATFAPFSGNDIEHNAFPSGDSTCVLGQTGAQIVFEGPVSVAADVAAACAAATADTCAGAAAGACMFNAEANGGQGLCAPAYPLLGGSASACSLKQTNRITGYDGDTASDTQGPGHVGISAELGAWVNAQVNVWKHTNPLFDFDYSSDASSLIGAGGACAGQSLCTP